ncbi:MAG: lactate utilization protein [Clostridia bacterium]|nr:lactate utilization protein [Clostridia bacterium]
MENIIKALERNNIKAIHVKTKEDAKAEVEKMLFDGCTVSCGGSMSLKECGISELIKSDKYIFLDRNRNGITKSEREEVYRSVIGCDFYLCSANALTENGELINVDGNANRVSAIAFGPKKVIMVVGKNKIVKDVKEGFLRVKRIAAPKNCVRLNLDTPCAKLGHCISLLNNDNPDIASGCDSERRICCQYLVSAKQREKDRITVIICDEELGY